MKNICDICGKEFEGYGNNPAPLEGRICCDACNKTYVIPARLKKIDVKSKLGDASMETPQITELRKKIGYLISDEVRAIDGYDEALKTVDLSEDQRKTLEEIRNDEIDHTNKLNEIYKGLMTGAIEDDLTEDASNLKESFAGGYDPTTINTELETEPNVQDGLIESVSNVVEKIGNLSTAAEDCDEKVKDAKSWIVGKTYRQKVNSKQGYEDWEFTGKTMKGPDGKILHAMKSMDLGTQWFDEDELNEMNIIDDDQDVQETLKENEISSSVTDAKMTVDRMIQIITPIVSDYAKKKGVEDYWKIHKNGKNVSVGMELGYRDMDKLCDILNAKLAPLTDSYFEPADAGLIETTVFDSAIRDMSIKDMLIPSDQKILIRVVKDMSYPRSPSYSIEDFKKELYNKTVGWDIGSRITSSKQESDPERYRVVFEGIGTRYSVLSVTLYRTKSKTYIVVRMQDENGSEITLGTKPTKDSAIKDSNLSNAYAELKKYYPNARVSMTNNTLIVSNVNELGSGIKNFLTNLNKKYGKSVSGFGGRPTNEPRITNNEALLFINDSDTVNDIGEITVGSKYRFEEKYGNQPLTVTELGETVKLSLDNSKTYLRIPREKFEDMVRTGRLDNTDTTTIEQYGAIKTGDRKVVDFKSDELVNEIRTKFNSLGKSKIDAYIEQLKAQGGYKDFATRLVWYLLHSTTSSRDISDWYYKYDVNDDHITRAGKDALRRMGINL